MDALHVESEDDSTQPPSSAVLADSHDHEGSPACSDSGHKCGTCGACHAVALTSAQYASASHELPEAELAEAFSVLATRAPHVLDKPPRG